MAPARRPPREVACDESGYEGENLVGGETDVFAHAGVLLTDAAAADCITELRRRIRSPALEYKANHLLREKHRPVLVWLLGPHGPIHGRAGVHLVDKSFLVVSKIVELLVGTPEDLHAMARTLYRAGRRAAPDRWGAFLESANTLMRARNRQGVAACVASFYRAVDDLLIGAPDDAAAVLGLFGPARSRVETLRTQLVENPLTIPALDPLVPAIVRTVLRWSADGVPVRLVHDRQTALTDERIAQITRMFGEPERLAGLRLVDSRSDPRVQVADFLAGVARKIASDELAGAGDEELVVLLSPYVDPHSLWGEDRSGSRLTPVRLR